MKTVVWPFSGIDQGENNPQITTGSLDCKDGMFLRGGDLTKREGTVAHGSITGPLLSHFNDRLIEYGDGYFSYGGEDFPSSLNKDFPWTDITTSTFSIVGTFDNETMFSDYLETVSAKFYSYSYINTLTTGIQNYECYILITDLDDNYVHQYYIAGELVSTAVSFPICRFFANGANVYAIYNSTMGAFYRAAFSAAGALNSTTTLSGLTGHISITALWDGEITTASGTLVTDIIISYTDGTDVFAATVISGTGTEDTISTTNGSIVGIGVANWQGSNDEGDVFITYSNPSSQTIDGYYWSPASTTNASGVLWTGTGTENVFSTGPQAVSSTVMNVWITNVVSNADGTYTSEISIVKTNTSCTVDSEISVMFGGFLAAKPELMLSAAGGASYALVTVGDLKTAAAGSTQTNTVVLITEPTVANTVIIAGKTLVNTHYSSYLFLTKMRMDSDLLGFTTPLVKTISASQVAPVLVDVDLDFTPTDYHYDNGVIFNGSVPRHFDGLLLTEMGFLHTPEIGATLVASTGNLTAGAYSYKAIYEWRDNSGNFWRSATSVADTVTTVAGSLQVTVSVKTLSLTSKNNVKINLYRTVADGSIHYKLVEITNSKSGGYVAYTDNVADTTIESNELLYTDQGILDYIQPGSFVVGNFSLNRFFYAPRDDGNFIYYSNVLDSGAGISFTGVGEIFPYENDGDITAINHIQQTLVIFKENSIHLLQGDGINQQGSAIRNVMWGEYPVVLSKTVGCEDARSVLLTDQGLVFQDQKGIYMLSTDMNLTNFGKQVKYFDPTIVGAYADKVKECYVFVTTNEALVYFYKFDQWVRWTGYGGTHSTQIDNVIYFNNVTQIVKETSTKTDLAADFTIKVVTPWFAFGKINGYQRLKKVYLLGWQNDTQNDDQPLANGDGEITLLSGYNYQPAEHATDTSATDITPFDYTEYYSANGVATTYDYQPLQLRWDPHKQSCSSYRLTIEATHDDIGFTALTFFVDGKKGGPRLGSGRKF